MKEILSLISSSVKKGFPVIFLASSTMELSFMLGHSKLMALSLDMIHFGSMELSGCMDHSSCV
jgi:hypothetical protein